ncbi:metal-sulfur cluster biosynthetic enzyme [Mycobacterium sp. MS1601]|uniref:metal-sulfur cluster assembly factor n=1 Tax=Mycobacterium sp. MS1601 TaxID=1936029 RepID=UPI00097919C4|nr:iron-sulfur cluster assembly protein [Mycobacterium sp. MS1601]AQA04321.1 metal-sulfur cluster biosynthetic enzyme [Mycobacterium sp. MS1601]
MTRYDQALQALSGVVDPELDEPITDLGFVHSLVVSPARNVKVHLRLPTSFCSPNFAYLMAADAKDALTALDWTNDVVVELDDHHDSPIINAGLASDAGYRGTFGHEALDSLDELRQTFHRKAHTAAMERCLTALVRDGRPEASLGEVTLADLPANSAHESLLKRREKIGLSTAPTDLVLVDHTGHQPDDVVLALRKARSTRISIDGNAHFCRGLLKTRYDSPVGPAPEHTLIPLVSLQGASS